MDSDDVAAVVAEVTTLVNEHYVDPAAAVQITRALAASLAGGRYAADEQSLAAAVTADLQSVNGDKHLRLVYHTAPLDRKSTRLNSSHQVQSRMPSSA